MMIQPARILVIDDEAFARAACVQALTAAGYEVVAVEDGRSALDVLSDHSCDAALLDLKMSGLPGMDVLRRIRERHSRLAVIMISGNGTIEAAIQAMKLGARDFLQKPVSPERLVRAVQGALRDAAGPPRATDAQCPRLELIGAERIVVFSVAMREVMDMAEKVASSDSTVLITGETGVGKEVVARAIHRMSRRADKPFVTVDCGSLVETLFESELFGHVKGAFSGAVDTTRGKFETAAGGTIFLDEIANVSLNMQSRLLRVIETREMAKVGSTEKKRVDARIISATNRDLIMEIRRGRFRKDLYYRLNVVKIHIPPLRERVEALMPLAAYYLEKIAGEKKKRVVRISQDARYRLLTHDWPGNVRELVNSIERAVVVCEGESIGPEDLPHVGILPPAGLDVKHGALAVSERHEIEKALRLFNGHKAKSAAYLGIHRKTLRQKIHRYGIAPPN